MSTCFIKAAESFQTELALTLKILMQKLVTKSQKIKSPPKNHHSVPQSLGLLSTLFKYDNFEFSKDK